MNFFTDKRLRWSLVQNLFCASVITFLFSLHYRNCLPFSGRSPIFNSDSIEIWGRYLVWAKEPFHFPKFGLVKSLAYPFQTCNMAHGPMALFALLFKFLSRAYPPIGHFYYFTFMEMVFVFMASILTFVLLSEFKVRSFWLKLLGCVTVALSFPLLFRTTTLTFEVSYVPGYLTVAYFYIRAYKDPGFFSFLILTLIFPIAVLIDDYLFLGIAIMLLTSTILNGMAYLMNKSKANQERFRGMAIACVLGIMLSSMTAYFIGNTGNLQIPHDVTPMTGRDDTRWAYGGGYGGGFHVADVLGVFIPPQYNTQLPSWEVCGPSAYLTKMGFPLTTTKLQDGQFEGFDYAGTVTLGILLILMVAWTIAFFKNHERYWVKLKLELISGIFFSRDFASLPVIMGLSSFALYVISWGYIIHLGGVRHNDIVTPSLIIAEYFHKFIWARSMGRLAVPFMLFIALGAIVWLDNLFSRFIYSKTRGVGVLCAGIFLLLAVIHIGDIHGYLKAAPSVQDDNITNRFGHEDQALIRQVMRGKSVLMVTPYAMDNMDWGEICYSLAYYGKIPMAGPNTTLNKILNPNEFAADNQDILSGNIIGLVKRYGKIVIAARTAVAGQILKNADTPLKAYPLKDQDVVLLALN